MTTKAAADQAAEWLDSTMNGLLNKYGLLNCTRAFGSNIEETPREETKVRPDSFILDYISALHIEQNLNREREGKERSPPDTHPKKRRALVVYTDSELYA